MMPVYGLDSSGLGQGPMAGFCKRGNETSGLTKIRKTLEQLSKNTASLDHIRCLQPGR